MEATSRLPLRLPAVGPLRVDLPAFGAWLLPVLLILYLALNNGGYDVVERSEAGIIVWWIVLVGTAVAALPVAGGTRAGAVMLAMLTAFAAWTALSLGWTESAEQTSIELGRVSAYLGFFAVALAVQGEGRWRHLLAGVTCGVVLVCCVAVFSRLEPTLFPDRVTGQFLPGIEIERRLAYPLNYASGLGSLAAIALPLLLAATASARTLIVQALSAAAIPVVVLTLWLTTSALSLPAGGIGLAVFLALAPDRIPKLATLLAGGAGSAILLAAQEQREALDRGLPTQAAQQQGDEMFVIILVVGAGVALAQTGIGLAVRYGERPRWMQVSRQHATVATALTLASLFVIGVAAGGVGQVQDAVNDFKDRGSGAGPDQNRASQILNFGGSGRYQFWESAVDQTETAPWRGTGPGTFQYWWSRNGTFGPVRDTHSLYFQTLGELGIPGLVLIIGFVGGALLLGVSRALRAPPSLRLGLAAATAGAATFAVAAAVDWDWQLGVLPATFMMLVAVIAAGGATMRLQRRERARRGSAWRRWLPRTAVAALAAAAMVAIALPLATTQDLGQSRRSAADGDLAAAITEARSAAKVQPYAASPLLQEAQLLEIQGRFAPAADAARDATRAESTNWRTWLILSRLEARAGDAKASLAAYRRAVTLGAPEFG